MNLVIFLVLFYLWNNCFWDTEGVGRKCAVPLTKILITEIKLSCPHSKPAWQDEVYWKAYQRIRLFLSCDSKHVPDLPTRSKRHINSKEYYPWLHHFYANSHLQIRQIWPLSIILWKFSLNFSYFCNYWNQIYYLFISFFGWYHYMWVYIIWSIFISILYTRQYYYTCII